MIDRSPDGQYYAEVTYYTRLSYMPMMPGHSGDKQGFVEVFNRDRVSCGRIPVTMISSVDLTWTENGASAGSQGEWDFKKGTCFYWDQSGNEKIYVKGGH